MSKKQFLLPTEKELFFSFVLIYFRQVLFFASQNRMPSVMLAQE